MLSCGDARETFQVLSSVIDTETAYQRYDGPYQICRPRMQRSDARENEQLVHTCVLHLATPPRDTPFFVRRDPTMQRCKIWMRLLFLGVLGQ